MSESGSLYFESTGPEGSPAIVFLHGGGAASWMWRKQVQVLSAHYRCIVPDLPEQGQSQGCGPFSMEYAADLVADLVLQTVPAGMAHFVGLSEGAQVIVSTLSRHPEVVNHAMISSAILHPLPGSSMYTAGLIRLMHRWFIEPLKNNNWWIRVNMHYAAGIPDEYFEEFKQSFQSTREDGFINMMRSNLQFRLPPGLEKFNRPVLVVTGSKEYKQMKDSARDLLRVLPNARGVSANLGKDSSLAKEHNWALTFPDLFTSTISSFIENNDLPVELKMFN